MTSLFFRSEYGDGLYINGKFVEIQVPELSIPLDFDHQLSLELLEKEFLGNDTNIKWRIPHPVIFLLASFNLDNLNLLTLERPIVNPSLPGSSAISNFVSTPAICVWAKEEPNQVLIYDSKGSHELGKRRKNYSAGSLMIEVGQ